MGSQNMQTENIDPRAYSEVSFSKLEKYALLKAHPRKIIFDLMGAIWSVYFLWNHEWRSAVIILMFGSLLGLYLVRDMNFESMAQTTLGKISLLHLRPVNLVTQIAGVTVAAYAIWDHSIELTLLSLSLLLVGHVVGWSRVDPRFIPKENGAFAAR